MRKPPITESISVTFHMITATLQLDNLDDAELAAREANRLDEKFGAPWACLALVNYRSCLEPHLARQCLTMALQVHLISLMLLY